jgi:hypothetical protein
VADVLIVRLQADIDGFRVTINLKECGCVQALNVQYLQCIFSSDFPVFQRQDHAIHFLLANTIIASHGYEFLKAWTAAGFIRVSQIRNL